MKCDKVVAANSSLGERPSEKLPPAVTAAHPPSVWEVEDDRDAGDVEGVEAGVMPPTRRGPPRCEVRLE
jgi:hypothetical protein